MKRHIPILAKEINEQIPDHAQIIVDGTLGHGGHTDYFITHATQKNRTYIGVDVDPQILEQAKNYLSEHQNIHFINNSYAQLSEELAKRAIPSVDYILLDLGINREHVLNADRGFSIRKDGPLDMRFAPDKQTAYELIQTCTEQDLTDRLIRYGDFKPHVAKGYAQYIKKNKADPRVRTTLGLRELMREIRVNDRQLAVIFQVLRIVVNKELEQVEIFCQKLANILATWGRCAIITFHSVEDRLVKYLFKDLAATEQFQLVNKKVIKPHYTEVQRNKASRSAKLRIIEKL